MNKELLEDLIIEFDEMSYEPTILCDSEKEVESFRNRLKQVLNYLKSVGNTKADEALEIIKKCESSNYLNTWYPKFVKDLKIIENYILTAQELENENIEYKKVLKIVFEKNVNTLLLELAENVDAYNERIVPNGRLTQKEFDLAKRWQNKYCE